MNFFLAVYRRGGELQTPGSNTVSIAHTVNSAQLIQATVKTTQD